MAFCYSSSKCVFRGFNFFVAFSKGIRFIHRSVRSCQIYNKTMHGVALRQDSFRCSPGTRKQECLFSASLTSIRFPEIISPVLFFVVQAK